MFKKEAWLIWSIAIAAPILGWLAAQIIPILLEVTKE